MKPNGVNHPKVQMLADALHINHSWALGIKEHLQHFAARSTPTGDVGKWGDTTIATECKWPPRDAKRLIRALLDTRIIERIPKAHYYLHDWHEHCEQSVHMFLARHGLCFANGELPNMSKLSQDERSEILCAQSALAKAHKKRTHTRESAQDADSVRTSLTRTRTRTVTRIPTPTQRERVNPPLPPNGPGNGNGVEIKTETTDPEYVAELVDEIRKTVKDPKAAIRWWTAVVTTLSTHPAGIQHLDESLTYIRDCADPAKRKAKDLGILTKPAAYLTKRVTQWAKAHQLRIPNTRKVKPK